MWHKVEFYEIIEYLRRHYVVSNNNIYRLPVDSRGLDNDDSIICVLDNGYILCITSDYRDCDDCVITEKPECWIYK